MPDPGPSGMSGAIVEAVTDNQPDDADDSDAAETRVCSGCGAVATGGEALTWLCSVENGARRYFCDTCSRTHLRSVEGRLDSTWW